MDSIDVPTFLKWAGGKTKLLKQMSPFFPNEIEHYVEPFIGGGAVLLFCLKYRLVKKAEAFDINPDLINVYIMIRDWPEKIIKELQELEDAHNSSNDVKLFYYNCRIQFNSNIKNKLKKAALFIYLNKACYNGLYRVNALGEFNVPFGKYEKLKIYDKDNILDASKLIQDVTFKVQDFRKIKYGSSSLIYFDPPYWSEQNKNGFTGYHKGEFTEKDQMDLRNLFLKLASNKRMVLLSNSNTKLINSIYQNAGISKIPIQARWMINCQGKNRKILTELLIVWSPNKIKFKNR